MWFPKSFWWYHRTLSFANKHQFNNKTLRAAVRANAFYRFQMSRITTLSEVFDNNYIIELLYLTTLVAATAAVISMFMRESFQVAMVYLFCLNLSQTSVMLWTFSLRYSCLLLGSYINEICLLIELYIYIYSGGQKSERKPYFIL